MSNYSPYPANRVRWVDVAKFIGIYSIYVFHFGEGSKNAYNFTYVYCVPIFYFLSGCMMNLEHETKIIPYIKKKFLSLMVPFYMFSLLALIVDYLVYNPDLSEVDNIVSSIVAGAVRNHYFSPGLWFLTCLFVMEIAFFFIKMLKNKFAIIGLCLALYIIGCEFLKADINPSWWYNVDSAMYYIFSYALGYVLYPYISKLFALDNIWKKIAFYVSTFLGFVYSFLLYENVDLLHKLGELPFNELFFPLIRAFIVIWFILCISKIAEHVDILCTTGQDTLYLCGSEFIVKGLLPYFLGVFGISVYTFYPIQIFIYSFIVIMIAEKFFVPVEKKMRHGFKEEHEK